MRHRPVTYSAGPNRSEIAFQALADPTRRAVLDLLRKGSQPAGQIAEAFPISRPAISKHLRLLRRAHLVREHREGRNRVYELNAEPLRAVDFWLEHYRVFWTASLNGLKALLKPNTNEKPKRNPKSRTNPNRFDFRKEIENDNDTQAQIASSDRTGCDVLHLHTGSN